jgi:hypothetical protein
MKKRKVAVILLCLALALLVYWAASGASLWTTTQAPVEVKDELFGTTSIQWKDRFRAGLEFTAPVVLVLLGAAGWIGLRGRSGIGSSGTEKTK